MNLNIEQIAKQLFEQFGEEETGIRPDWAYLSKDRQLAWKKDVYCIAKSLVTEIQQQVKPVTPPDNINTSWAVGYNAGLQQERVIFITLLENLLNDLEDQVLNGR